MFQVQSPFERMRALFAPVEPAMSAIDLSVGSPRHAPPDFVAEVLVRDAGILGAYPAIVGTAEFQEATHAWLDSRYALDGFLREKGALLPTSGSREGLFFAAITARDILKKADPVILFANPFYQAYPAAAHAIGAEALPVAAADPTTILPDPASLPRETLDRAIAYYVGSPSNPVGNCASLADWNQLFDLALAHDFFIFADECYSEIYREAAGAPRGALEAAKGRPEALSRLFVFNSLSKRSNLAGLRAGFVAGERQNISAVKDFRNQAAPQVPVPIQAVAAAAFRDETHVTENRRLYDAKFAAAEEALAPIFGPLTPQGGFFLWLPVGGDDENVALELWRALGVRTVPGSYLAAEENGRNPGAGYVRLALVGTLEETEEAFARLRDHFAEQRQVRLEPVS